MPSTEHMIKAFIEQHPDDAVRALETFDKPSAVKLLTRLPKKALHSVFERAKPENSAQWLVDLPMDMQRELLMSIHMTQAGILLKHLEESHRAEILSGVSEQVAHRILEMSRYDPDMAGGIVDARVTTLPDDLTVQQAIARVRRAERQTLYYLYVTNRDGQLVGVLNMRDLLLSGAKESIRSILSPNVLSISATMPREEAIQLMCDRGLIAAPVVDDQHHLIGVIKHAQAMQASQEAPFVDMQRMVGAGGDEKAMSPATTVVARRLPWLCINLLTAFVAAGVVGMFEDTIARFTALAVLLPVVAGQGGNSGAQSLAVVMRGLALKEIKPGMRWRVLLKEALGGLINGLAIGVITAAAVWFWQPNVGLALVIGLAMPITMLAAALAGTAIPMALQAMGRDPAQSATIFLTTVTDVIGFLSFLGLAALLAHMLA